MCLTTYLYIKVTFFHAPTHEYKAAQTVDNFFTVQTQQQRRIRQRPRADQADVARFSVHDLVIHPLDCVLFFRPEKGEVLT